MAEAMEVDSVLTGHTNDDNIISTKSYASVFQENTDKPASVLQKTTTDEPTSALQEKTTDKPQIPSESFNKCKPLIQENNSPNPESSDTTDSANCPNRDGAPLQKTTMEEPQQVSLEKVCVTEPLVDISPKQQPSIETPVMDKHDTNMEENVRNREPNKNISNGKPVKKSGSQELPKITDPATECQDCSKNVNKPNENKDTAMEESTKSSKQQNLDMSLNSDIELIAKNVPTFDLTRKDTITQSNPLYPTNKTDNIATEELEGGESPKEPVKSSKNKSVNPQKDGQNKSSDLTADDSLQQETLKTRSNSRNEPKNFNDGEPKENEPLRNPRDKSSQNNSTLTKTDQDKTHISIEESVVNETPTENNNLEVAPEEINQNIEEDVLMNECNANESVNTQTVSTSEPKSDQSSNAANKTELKATRTQNSSPTKNESNRRQCSYCLKFHPDDVCWKEWKAKGPKKRGSDQLPESPAAKKQHIWPKYPPDMVSLIAKHTYYPNMTMRIKMKLVRECQILNFKPIPTSWSNKQMIEFIKNHVRCFNETNGRFSTFTFVRYLKFNRTGECLVKFKSPDYCQKSWCDLRGVKEIEGTPISVDLDLGHARMKKAKRYNRLTAKYVPPNDDSLQQETPIAQFNSGIKSKNVYEGEPIKNEPSKKRQDESSQNDSSLSLCTNNLKIEPEEINQNNEDDISTIEQKKLKDVPEKINQNIEEDVSMKEFNATESVNTQTVSTSVPKADQSNNAANKTELKATTTQNNLPTKNLSNNKSRCSTCFKFHPEPCWHAKGPQKRDSYQSTESPAAKKQRILNKYPADMVNLIGRHTYDPNITKWNKMHLIRECKILTVKPIPTSWTRQQMIEFINNHVRFMNETNVCTTFFVRDEEFNNTGEWLVKFKSCVNCQKAWCDMRDVKIEDTPISVELDLGHKRMREAKRMSQLRLDYLKSLPPKERNSLDTSNEDEIQEQNSQANENDASNSNVNGSSVGNTSSNENAASSTAADGSATGPNNSASSIAETSSETQNYNKNPNFTCNSKPSFMPAEKFEKTTYGLNAGFLQSLGLHLPLRSGIVVLGLEPNLSDDKIKEIFSLAGTVKKVLTFRVMRKDSPTIKGVVEYDHPIEAVQAISMFNCQELYGRTLTVKMASQSFPRPLPEGLSAVGPGLGFRGQPMRGVRGHVEVESLKKMLMDFKNMFNSKIAEMEQSIASFKNAELEPHKKVPTPSPQTHSTETATQLVNALSSLTQPNVLMGWLGSTLLSAQGLGTDQAAMASQMMWQNAGYAQNVNMQGMLQPPLPEAFPRPDLTQPQPGLARPGLAQSGLAQPGLAQPQMIQPMEQSQMYYGLPQMMQPGFMGMQTIPPPAPGASVTKITEQPSTSYTNQPQTIASQQPLTSYTNQSQPIASQQPSTSYTNQPQTIASQQPSTSYTNQPQPVASQQPSTSYTNQPQPIVSQQPSTSYTNQPQPIAAKQQTHAYTPKVPKNKESSKNETIISKWNKEPVAAVVSQKKLEQKAVEQKPAYSSEASHYKRPSRFDMKEKPNLKVIVPEPEKKKDDLLSFRNLPSSVSREALNSKMREVGDVLFGEMTGRGRALVRFKHARDAERCFKLFNRSKVDGQVIKVEFLKKYN